MSSSILNIIKLSLIVLLWQSMAATSLFAQEPSAEYHVDLVSKINTQCNRDDNILNCDIWYEKIRVSIGTIYEKDVNQLATAANAIHAGLFLWTIPVMLINPESVIYSDGGSNPVSVVGVNLLEKIPATNEKVSVSINGVQSDVLQTSEEGKFSIKVHTSGVYELSCFGKKHGVALEKEIFVD